MSPKSQRLSIDNPESWLNWFVNLSIIIDCFVVVVVGICLHESIFMCLLKADKNTAVPSSRYESGM